MAATAAETPALDAKQLAAALALPVS